MFTTFEDLLGLGDATTLRADCTQSPPLYNLTDFEVMALRLWSKSDLHAELINARLRSTETLGNYQGMVELLDSALAKLPVTTSTVYRGIRAPSMAKIIRDYRVGASRFWPSFTSASQISDRAFAGNVLFAIQSRHGRPISMFASDYGELEVLFPRGSQFKVTRVLAGSDKAVAVIGLTEI